MPAQADSAVCARSNSLSSLTEELLGQNCEGLKLGDNVPSFVSCKDVFSSDETSVTTKGSAGLPLRIRDLSSGGAIEVHANTREPFVVENETCTGKAILKVRTNPEDEYYAPYFAGKKRMFEVMIEGKLKHVHPEDHLYIGIETDSKVELNGFWANAAAQVIMALIEYTVPDAHVTLGDDMTHCYFVFPLDTTADRLCVTPPGGTPPAMGVAMFSEEYSKSNRPKHVAFNTEDTYSLSIHSMYVDLVNWRLVNLPGISYICLDAFMRDKSLRFVSYAIPRGHTGPHTDDVKRYIFNFEIDNTLRERSS